MYCEIFYIASDNIFRKLKQINKYISELLREVDCVIIPGLGAFVANPESAAVDTRQHTFSPPYKDIGFNKNINRNDGLLADRIAEREQISFEQANANIHALVKDCIQRLQNGQQIIFDGIGALSVDSARNIQFKPDESTNFLSDSFGLDSFHSPAIKRQSFEKRVEQEIIERSPIPIEKSTVPGKGSVIPLRVYYSAAASVLLIAACSWLYINLDMIKGVDLNYSDLNPFARLDSGTYIQRIDKTAEVGPEEGTDAIQEWLDNVPEETKEVVAEVEEVVKATVVKRFHVIGGCFEIKSNADRLQRKLKRAGFDSGFVGKNRRGLYRVSFGSYETRAEARKALRKIKRNNMKSAWLYVGKK